MTDEIDPAFREACLAQIRPRKIAPEDEANFGAAFDQQTAPTMGFPPHPPLQLGSTPNEVAFRAAILKPPTPEDVAAFNKAWDQQKASNKPDSWVPEQAGQAGQKPPTETQWGEPLPYATMEYLLKRREEARQAEQSPPEFTISLTTHELCMVTEGLAIRAQSRKGGSRDLLEHADLIRKFQW